MVSAGRSYYKEQVSLTVSISTSMMFAQDKSISSFSICDSISVASLLAAVTVVGSNKPCSRCLRFRLPRMSLAFPSAPFSRFLVGLHPRRWLFRGPGSVNVRRQPSQRRAGNGISMLKAAGFEDFLLIGQSRKERENHKLCTGLHGLPVLN